MHMIITINEHIELNLTAQNFNDFQRVVQDQKLRPMMTNPIDLISYLEMNDPAMMEHSFQYARDNDEAKFYNAVKNFVFTPETLQKYVAHLFGVRTNQVRYEF